MRRLTGKTCRICGNPVVPKKRTDREAFYYPQQCLDCRHKVRDEAARIAKIKKYFKENGHPTEVPIGTRTKHNAGRGLFYWRIKTKKGWNFEHRIVMEKILKRPLRFNEHVHHLNENSLDNRPENLAVMGSKAHLFHHIAKLGHRWSLKFDRCIHCGKTKYRHIAKGQCSSCYQKLYRLGIS